MVLNRRELAAYCTKNNLVRKATDSKSRYIIIKDGKELGVIECMPTNNGKYYAYRNGIKADCYSDLFKTRPNFDTFEKAVEHVTRHVV